MTVPSSGSAGRTTSRDAAPVRDRLKPSGTAVDAMLLTAMVLWAANVPIAEYVLNRGVDPLVYSTIRYGSAVVVFVALALASERTLRVSRSDLRLIALVAAFIYLNQLGFVYALDATTASTTALVLGMTPVIVALLARATGLERPSWRTWAATLVSVAGVAVMAFGSGGVSAQLRGVLLALFAAVTWALYTVGVAPLLRRYSPLRINAVVLPLSWVPLSLTATPQLMDQSFRLEALTWAGLAYSALVALVLTHVIWFTAIHRVGPSRAAVFVNLQPFVAALFALLLLSESLGVSELAGGILIGTGIALSRVGRSGTVEPTR